MGIAASIKAGEAFFEIMANDKTDKGIDSAERRLRRMSANIGIAGAAIAGVGAAGVASLGVLLRRFAGAGDDITDAMNVTGLSSDLLQGLEFAAADAGVGFNALIGAASKMNNTIAKAAAKGGDVLGISARDLLAMNPDERFLALVDAIEKIPNPAQRAAAAIAVFGKSGAKLLPAFEGGAAAVIDAINEMKASGEIMSDGDRQLAAETEGAFLTMGLRMQRVAQLVGASVAPAFLWLAAGINATLKSAIRFIDNHRTLVAIAGVSAGVLLAVGTALMIVGVAGVTASFATAGLTAAMTALSAVAAFLVSPLFVIGAAIALCGTAAVIAAYGLDQAVNSGKGLRGIQTAATDAAIAVQLLHDAIVGGQWGLAGELIWASLKLSFLQGIVELKSLWSDFNVWFTNSLIEMAAKAAAVVGTIAPGVGDAARKTADELKASVAQDADAGLADDRKKAADAAFELMKIVARIGALGRSDKFEVDVGSFANIATSASGSLQSVQTLGALSSTAAAMLNQSAPGNQGVDKMQELVDINKDQQETLEGISEKLDDLETLTVE